MIEKNKQKLVQIIDDHSIQELVCKIVSLERMIMKLMDAQKPDRMLTNEELIKELGISKKTAYVYRTMQKLKFSKIGGKFFYKHSDVLKFIDKYSPSPKGRHQW